MDGNVEVVLAKGYELVDDNLSAGCIGCNCALIIMVESKEALEG